jgi:hypothetical protein
MSAVEYKCFSGEPTVLGTYRSKSTANLINTCQLRVVKWRNLYLFWCNTYAHKQTRSRPQSDRRRAGCSPIKPWFIERKKPTPHTHWHNLNIKSYNQQKTKHQIVGIINVILKTRQICSVNFTKYINKKFVLVSFRVWHSQHDNTPDCSSQTCATRGRVTTRSHGVDFLPTCERAAHSYYTHIHKSWETSGAFITHTTS